jgi:Fic family protein
MGLLEKFLHDDPVRTPVLAKAALAHAQFEAIHPFLDGNGRVGRLLVTLLLCTEEHRVLSRPLLYLSLYLKRNRDECYTRLQRVRTDGEWEWLTFFLEGVIDVARSATETTQRIVSLIGSDRTKVLTLGRAAGSASRLHDIAVSDVVFTIPEAARRLELSGVSVGKAAGHLEDLGIVGEVNGQEEEQGVRLQQVPRDPPGGNRGRAGLGHRERVATMRLPRRRSSAGRALHS